MDPHTPAPAARMLRAILPLLLSAGALLPEIAIAQDLTGSLVGTVRDEQGGAIAGAQVRLSSPALLGGPAMVLTDERGEARFPVLMPGRYVLEASFKGFTPSSERDIRVGAGAMVERPIVLRLAGIAETVAVDATESDLPPRSTGFETRFDAEYLSGIPTRRSSMFDAIRSASGISPTSPTSAINTTVSAFGSGTNENQFFIDGTPTTCPCNGVARSEPGVDFIQEVQVQSFGLSAEFGNMQGAAINVVTRQGSDRFLYDASYYAQPSGLTSQPVRLSFGELQTGYERVRYRDFTTNAGGPAMRDRLWFFGGYQYLRDYDSQPGSDPQTPRSSEQDKLFGKLTWKLRPGLQLLQSFHDEIWVKPDPPTRLVPFEATLRRSASVPAVTFGHLTHTLSSRTVWDVRVGRFAYTEEREPSTGDRTIANRVDRLTNVSSGAPPQIGGLTLIRTTGKATLSHYRPKLIGGTHTWKMGTQVERGEQHGVNVIPTGVRFTLVNGVLSQAVSSDPSHTGASFITAGAFATDTVTIGERVTVDFGVRFDHSRAVSQDVRALDSEGRETTGTVRGLGTLYTWNLWSPRLGVTTKLTASGRMLLRATYGRFSQGVLTGEFSGFHPGVTSTVTTDLDTGRVRTLDPRKNLLLDPGIRAPHTDEYSVGVDRQVGRLLALGVFYMRKSGIDFIGWEDVGGRYHAETRTLPDGRSVPVFVLENSADAQRFLLTNPGEYFMRYNGLVAVVEKRRADGWQASASYTFSRVSGMQASSGTTAAGPQASTVAAPTPSFGRDPNDLTNAVGRLPNDRPHMLRLTGSANVPKTGFVIAANLQHFSGKPWAATALIDLSIYQQARQQRVQLEPRGARRLSSQTLLDVRLSRTVALRGWGRIEVLVDVLNALNDAAEESLTETLMTEAQISPTFGQPASFIEPRRAMLGIRLNLGR